MGREWAVNFGVNLGVNLRIELWGEFRCFTALWRWGRTGLRKGLLQLRLGFGQGVRLF